MRKETNAELRQLLALLSKKWDREYLAVCEYVQALLLISLVRSFSHLLRVEREKKGGGGEPRGAPATDGTEMRRMDLRLED